MRALCPEYRAILRADGLVARPASDVMDHRPSPSPPRRVRAQLCAAALAAGLVALALMASAPAATPKRTLAFARFLGPSPGQPGRLSGPTGVATDTADNVVVADTGHDRVVRLTAGGRYLRELRGAGPLSPPPGRGVGPH